MNDFNGFDVRLLIDEDGDWIAHFVELPTVSAGGKTPEQALAEDVYKRQGRAGAGSSFTY